MSLNKIFIVAGVLLSFISLTYTVTKYLEMRSVESLVKEESYGDDVVLEKLRQIDIAELTDSEIFLSEIRNRGKQLSSLRKGVRKIASRSKFFAGMELGLWLFSVSLFSILLIRERGLRDSNK